MTIRAGRTQSAKLGVVGAGWWSCRVHLPGLLEHSKADVVALAELDTTRRTFASKEFEIADTYRSHSELLERSDLDGVVVAVHHTAHFEVARDALERGLSVFIEKPMATNSADAWELVSLANKMDRQIAVGFPFQFMEQASRARETLESGSVGEALLIQAEYLGGGRNLYKTGGQRARPDDPDPSSYGDPEKSGGGALITTGSHVAAALLAATGGRVSEAHAFLGNLDAKVDLISSTAFRLESGTLGTFASASTVENAQAASVRVRYYCTNGVVDQDLSTGRLTVTQGTTTTHIIEQATPIPFTAPVQTFVDLLLGSTDNPSPGDLGARTVEFIEAAYLSQTTSDAPEGGHK
jgi:predicted dehydrogenase